MGLAASMGAFILASGTKGKRFCMPNARVMIHQPLGTAGGRATEMSIRIREMAYHKIKINKILSRITGKPDKQTFGSLLTVAASSGNLRLGRTVHGQMLRARLNFDASVETSLTVMYLKG